MVAQFVHAPPPCPQLIVAFPGTHLPSARRHPAQVQTLFTHRSTPEHSMLVPQRHAPSGPQLFDVVGSHDLHVLPRTPHIG